MKLHVTVSLSELPLASKLAERVLQRQLLKYLEDNRQLNRNQHAYRDKMNTTTALIQMMENITTSTDMNLITATMGLDQSATFDCVDHGILLEKLDLYGIDEMTKRWLRSYLSDRSGYVVIRSSQSSIKKTDHGIPQGSVLGQLMYLMYINE